MILRHIPKKIFILFLGDLFLLSLAFFISMYSRFGINWSLLFSWRSWVMVGVYLIVFYLSDLYESDVRFENLRYIYRFCIAIAIALTITSTLFYLIPGLKIGRSLFLLNALLVSFLAYAWRLIFELLFKDALWQKKNLLLIGDGSAGMLLYEAVKSNPNYNVLGFISDNKLKPGPGDTSKVLGDFSVLKEMVRSHAVDIVVVAITHFHGTELLKYVLECKLEGVEVYDMPSFYEKATGKVPVDHVTEFWLVFTPLSGVRKSVYNLKIKRIIDILLSLLGLVMTFPIAVITSLLIKLESRGPIFYKQKRIGPNGKSFEFRKFRSMKDGTENDRKHAGERDDPRVTRIGRIIRLLRIDEIPQMWSVLRGEMSFIGPRALMEEEVREFETIIPYFSLRHSISPGITGWAQVNYKHGITVEDAFEKLQYDLFYIKNLSPLLDFVILMKTIKVIMSGAGAR